MINAHITTRDGLGRFPADIRTSQSGGSLARFGDNHGKDAERWPAWKSAVFVIGFCGAFWGGIAYLAWRLFA